MDVLNKTALGSLIALASFSLSAAPLDGLLTVVEAAPGTGNIELSVDAVNNTLDIFKLRAADPVYGGSSVGDYTGGHLLADYAVTNRFAVAGGYWLRQLSYGADTEKIQSWQLETQYRVSDDEAPIALAIQTSVWGNSSTQLSKSTPTSVMGLTVDKVQVNNPHDLQLEVNGIASTQITDHWRGAGFIGVGNSQVSTGDLRLNFGGCQYSVNQAGQGFPVDNCGMIASFTINPTLLPVLNYQANYLQLGGSLAWRHAPWQIRTGYQYQSLQRDNVDGMIQSQGGKIYQTNHVAIADLQYDYLKNQAIFLRGQLMSNQFLGEIPFAYNSVTASKFDRTYGLLSMGVRVSF